MAGKSSKQYSTSVACKGAPEIPKVSADAEILATLENILNGKSDIAPQAGGFYNVKDIILHPYFKKLSMNESDLILMIESDSLTRFRSCGGLPADVTISKRLAYILRHGALKARIKISNDGYVYINDLLKDRCFAQRGITLEKIKEIVWNDPKGRYDINRDPLNNRMRIRALQGHSLNVDELELTPVGIGEFETIVHGTYFQWWTSIRSQGLSRMRRRHIHFVMDPEDKKVVSGMRQTAEILIYVDINAAIRHGIKFYRSKNNVVLTEGNTDGLLPTKYFARAVNRQTGQELWPTNE
ncbi:hypothetical protein ACTXT7_010947 [Hymenolepis weldensis]